MPIRKMVLLAGLLASTLAAAGELSGRRAPGFSLPDSEFKQHDLYDYRGKVVLLEIMLTRCQHCQVLAQALEKIKTKFFGRVTVLTVVIPPDNMDTVAEFIAQYKISSPILFDSGQMTASYLKNTPRSPKIDVPHLFIVDANGMIVNDYGQHESVESVTDGSLEREVERVLEKKAPASR